jgi:hypothetical protein
VEPQTIEQLKDFNQAVVLPVFEEIRETLEPLGYGVWTTIAKTGDEPFDELLHGLSESSGACFLSDIDSINSIWQKPCFLVAALIVQLPEALLVGQSFYEGRFCLGVQCNVDTAEPISATVLVFYAKCDGTFERFQDGFYPNEPDPSVATLTQSHLLQRFTDSFAAFRVQALQKSEPVLEPALETKETAVLDVPSPSAEPTEVSRRSEVSKFFQSLDVKRSLWPDEVQGRDFDRLFEWLDAVQNIPFKNYAHRQAQAELDQQAAQFAKLLKPQSAIVFTDYFDLYCSAVRRLCARLTNAKTDPAQVFIEQVEALRDPGAPSRADPKKLEEVSFLFRSLARQFGKPDEFMLREWIGESPMGICINESVKPELIISRIQAHNKEQPVRFNRLSWAVLQVFQNDDILLTDEASPGSNGVERFMHSAALTIWEPTEEVRCLRHQANEVEFIFERILLNDGRQQTAQARVIAFGTHGWVFLHSYGFEEE